MKTCPFFSICGGCKYDFTAPDYREQKLKDLPRLPLLSEPIWTPVGHRRRADFSFSGKKFGFFAKGSKDIIEVSHCQNLVSEINDILPVMANIDWGCSGSCLITKCDNGIDIAITSDVPYFNNEFRKQAEKIPAIRITWNDKEVKKTQDPIISFDDIKVEYPSGAFLQPCVSSEKQLRDLVVQATKEYKRKADLFCGLGNFTFATKATGFDIVGTGIKRDLFKSPLTVGMLNSYDCVIMDPPRAGAYQQCKELVKSDIKRIVYISCNPKTFIKDMSLLTANGYQLKTLIPVDQFVGSSHWEIFSIFDK